MINEFKDKYFFLSNFYSIPVTFNGIIYQNNEAAFQAQKDCSRTTEFVNLNPSDAKRLGRNVKLRPDWELVKYGFMYQICLCKFLQHPELKEKLIATGNEDLIEGNTWHDTYWGVCNGIGKNNLGKILMEIRDLVK